MKVKPLRWRFVVAYQEIAKSLRGKFSLIHMQDDEHQLCTPDGKYTVYATSAAAKRAAERMHKQAVLEARKEIDKWFV